MVIAMRTTPPLIQRTGELSENRPCKVDFSTFGISFKNIPKITTNTLISNINYPTSIDIRTTAQVHQAVCQLINQGVPISRDVLIQISFGSIRHEIKPEAIEKFYGILDDLVFPSALDINDQTYSQRLQAVLDVDVTLSRPSNVTRTQYSLYLFALHILTNSDKFKGVASESTWQLEDLVAFHDQLVDLVQTGLAFYLKFSLPFPTLKEKHAALSVDTLERLDLSKLKRNMCTNKFLKLLDDRKSEAELRQLLQGLQSTITWLTENCPEKEKLGHVQDLLRETSLVTP